MLCYGVTVGQNEGEWEVECEMGFDEGERGKGRSAQGSKISGGVCGEGRKEWGNVRKGERKEREEWETWEK